VLQDMPEIEFRVKAVVSGRAGEGIDPAKLVSNSCETEWPPRSGGALEIPEADHGRWFVIPEARRYIKSTQEPFLDRLCEACTSRVR
jgi:predicted NUDIX family NTP pyrophosphohydrolase